MNVSGSVCAMALMVVATTFGVLPSSAGAQRLPVTGDLVALDSARGRTMLLESRSNADFFELAATLETQQTQAYCGVASAVSVLNALPVAAPAYARWDPYRAFNQETLFGSCVRGVITPESVGRGGMTMGQLASLMQCYTVRATVTHASDVETSTFRTTLATGLARGEDLFIANYDRRALGQEGGGHLSPLGAYHEASDHVLVMDVARYKYPPVWVPLSKLFDAMRTTDPDSNRSRGFVTVTPTRRAPGPAPAGSTGGLMKIAAMLVGGGFLVGSLLGAGVMALLGRRSRKRAVAAARASVSRA